MYNLRRRSKLSLISIVPTSLLLLTLLLISSSQIYVKNTPKNKHLLHSHKHNQVELVALSACHGTLYRDLCVSTVASFPDLAAKSLPQIISSTVSHTVSEVRASSANCTGIEKRLLGARRLDRAQKLAIDDCLELLDDTVAELGDVIADLTTKKSASKHYHDLETLLSGAMTNQYTCLDGLSTAQGMYVRKYIEDRIVTISNHVSNILVMVKKIKGKHEATAARPSSSTRMLSEVFPEYGRVKNGFPTWVSSSDRRVLQSAVNETKYDLVVAKDGSGNFTTIGEAVAAAPNNSETRSNSILIVLATQA